MVHENWEPKWKRSSRFRFGSALVLGFFGSVLGSRFLVPRAKGAQAVGVGAQSEPPGTGDVEGAEAVGVGARADGEGVPHVGGVDGAGGVVATSAGGAARGAG